MSGPSARLLTSPCPCSEDPAAAAAGTPCNPSRPTRRLCWRTGPSAQGARPSQRQRAASLFRALLDSHGEMLGHLHESLTVVVSPELLHTHIPAHGSWDALPVHWAPGIPAARRTTRSEPSLTNTRLPAPQTLSYLSGRETQAFSTRAARGGRRAWVHIRSPNHAAPETLPGLRSWNLTHKQPGLHASGAPPRAATDWRSAQSRDTIRPVTWPQPARTVATPKMLGKHGVCVPRLRKRWSRVHLYFKEFSRLFLLGRPE